MSTKTSQKTVARFRRKLHIRKKVRGSGEKPRLVVFRSAKHIYAQLINDVAGRTLLAFGTNSHKAAELFSDAKNKTDAAFKLGNQLAELAKEKGIENVVFDRNGYIYHGRVKAVADGARKGGLIF